MWYQWLISLPMMVCFFWSIFFMVRCFTWSAEPRIKSTVLLFFIASTVLYTNHWLYFSEASNMIGAYTYLIANLSVYPLYYAYLRALTRAKKSIEIPLLLFPAFLLLIVFPLNIRYAWMDQRILLAGVRICFAVQVIWVWVQGFLLLRTTRRRMDDTYADNRSYLLHPTHVLFVLISITAVSSMVLNVIGRDFFAEGVLVTIPAVLMSILLYGLGYVAAHTFLPEETITQSEEEEEEKARTATMEETDELFNKIITALRKEKLFTNPNLTIQDLAAAVGSNRTYVSACINRRTNFSFSQLVAQYRVENAKAILADPQYGTDHDAVSSAIALSGFTSDQTFYRIFKELTGQTPLQYRRQNTPKM